MSGGELVTKPLTFEGNRLRLNFATSAAGSLRIALMTKRIGRSPGSRPMTATNSTATTSSVKSPGRKPRGRHPRRQARPASYHLARCRPIRATICIKELIMSDDGLGVC